MAKNSAPPLGGSAWKKPGPIEFDKFVWFNSVMNQYQDEEGELPSSRAEAREEVIESNFYTDKWELLPAFERWATPLPGSEDTWPPEMSLDFEPWKLFGLWHPTLRRFEDIDWELEELDDAHPELLEDTIGDNFAIGIGRLYACLLADVKTYNNLCKEIDEFDETTADDDEWEELEELQQRRIKLKDEIRKLPEIAKDPTGIFRFATAQDELKFINLALEVAWEVLEEGWQANCVYYGKLVSEATEFDKDMVRFLQNRRDALQSQGVRL